MSNEPFFKIFIDVFSKVLEVHFVTIVNGSKWRLFGNISFVQSSKLINYSTDMCGSGKGTTIIQSIL
jgi:hypothetical protein